MMSVDVLQEAEKMLTSLCRFPQYEKVKGLEFGGVKFENIRKAMLDPETTSIASVPLDMRWRARDQLYRHIVNREEASERVSLLCSAAFRGSGKTVLLHMNVNWFVEKTHGIAFHISFNDDQDQASGVWQSDDFEMAVSVRILHRLVQSALGDKYNIRDVDHVLSKLVESLKPNTIPLTLKLVRRVVGAPENTKILLAVDEIALSANEQTNLQAKHNLKILVKYMDMDERLFLAVAAYGAVDILKMATDSARSLLIQYLGPLYSAQGFDPKYYHLLPPALKPFFIEKQRVHLPYSTKQVPEFDPLEVYNKLSVLIQKTGGHPRKMEALFKGLNKFSFSEKVVDKSTGVQFAKALNNWLRDNENMIGSYVDNTARFPSKWSDLSKVELADAVEQIAVDAACAFDLPENQEAAKRHKYSLLGTTTGHCSLVNVGEQNLVFIPPPVLRALSTTKDESQLKPCGQALFKLAEAICEHQTIQTSFGGKSFEKVVAAALLLYARSNAKISPEIFCRKDFMGSEILNKRFIGRGGDETDAAKIEWWEDITEFPLHRPDSETDDKFTQRMKEEIALHINQLIRTGSFGAVCILQRSTMREQTFLLFSRIMCTNCVQH